MTFDLKDMALKALLVFLVLATLAVNIYQYGVQAERKRWQDKANTALIKSQEKVMRLNTLNRELERSASLQAQSLKTLYEGKIQDEKKHADSVIADLRSGIKRLSVGIKPRAGCASTGSKITADIASSQNPARAELSDAASEFLIGLAAEADTVVIESNMIKAELLACRDQYEQLSTLCEAQ
jgi:prophage endopeptidase